MKRLLRVCGLALALMITPPVEATEAERAVAYVIPIRGMIEPALLYVVRRGLAEADRVRARAVIFVFDTPGGTVEAAGEIVRLMRQITVPRYAFIEKQALSAGAIIALTAPDIYMAPGSVIGDAMPILMSPFGGVQEMSEDLREKAVSAVAALIRTAAEAGGHNKDLAEKMVRREKELKIGDEVISPAGELLTLTNEEAERRLGPDQTPLLSKGTVRNLDELLERIGLTDVEVRELQVTWAERVARWVAALAPLFLMLGLLGIYVEIKTPGFGVPGVLGILCLAIFFWGHHIAGLAGLEDILIFALGAILLAIELFVLPGFGVVGIAGIALILWSLFAAMFRWSPALPDWSPWTDLRGPLFKLSSAIVGVGIAGALLGRWLPRSSLFGKLVLAQATSRDAGFSAARDVADLLGQEGVAVTPLRPAGVAMFGERRIDVVTNGEYIDAGARIVVIECHGNRVVVEAAGQSSRSTG